jgi:hypothetical protein
VIYFIKLIFSLSKGLYALDNEVIPDEFWEEVEKTEWRKKNTI